MTLAALIFDVDGTPAETEETHRRPFNETFAAAGLTWHWTRTDYQLLPKTTGGQGRMQAHRAAIGYGPTNAEIARLHLQKTARYGALLAQGAITMRPGIANLMQNAWQSGLKVALPTPSRPNLDALCLACWGKPARPLRKLQACVPPSHPHFTPPMTIFGNCLAGTRRNRASPVALFENWCR